MPIHDWTRVDDGVFHAFHNSWIARIQDSLNDGRLPEGYYALGEQRAGVKIPDVVTLRRPDPSPGGGGLLLAPPLVRQTLRPPKDSYLHRQKVVSIRHVSGDSLVSLIEIVSASNKEDPKAVSDFIGKTLQFLRQGIHVGMIDLHPPTSRDPIGMHSIIWNELYGVEHPSPDDQPLTAASYEADPDDGGIGVSAHLQPCGVGETLDDLPVFLEPGGYVLCPLQQTYDDAYRLFPRHLKEILEAK